LRVAHQLLIPFCGGNGLMEKNDLNQQIDHLLGRLRTLRDEIRVRSHLGSMELHDARRELETRLDEAERTAKQASAAVLAALRELEAKFLLLGEKLASAEPLGGGLGSSAR
jgi:hypothetical protein